jgi:uncharacterized protein (TIGR02231 family)
MKKLFLAIAVIMIAPYHRGEDISAKSRINSVEVFSDRAIVERIANLDLAPGSQSIVFDNLPPGIVDNSIKVSGKGTSNCEILGTEAEDQDIEIVEIKELEQQLEQLEIEKKNLNASLDLLSKQEDLLRSILSNSTNQLGKEVSEGKPDIVSIDKLFAFLTSKYDQIKKDRMAFDLKISDIEKKKRELNKELAKVRTDKTQKGKKVSVLVRCDKPGSLALSLFYTVRGCSWAPFYIGKALPESSQIEVSMMASIIQKTYEDWDNAEVKLSTSMPSQGILPSELSPTFLDFYVPQPERRDSKKAEAYGGGVEGGVLGGVMEAAPAMTADNALYQEEEKMVPANYANASLAEAGMHLNFSIKGRIDVASDGKNHKFFINRNAVDAKYDYYGVPRQDDKAFMRAIFTNKLEYPILPGEVELFYQGELVGSAYLPGVARNQEAEAYFGRNDEIKLSFEEVNREKSPPGFMGNKERIKIKNLITVENHTKNEISIEILDKLPKPQRAEIELIDVRIVPDRDSEKPNNLMSWVLTLKAQEKKEITVEYSIEYPKGVVLRGM